VLALVARSSGVLRATRTRRALPPGPLTRLCATFSMLAAGPPRPGGAPGSKSASASRRSRRAISSMPRVS
jgi:hypothetical protein